MRAMAMALVGSVAFIGGAEAQTADFKCAKPGTVVEFADGTRSTAQGGEGNLCRLLVKMPGQEEYLSNWYAPTMSLRATQSQAFAEQVKPWTLWPLSVGKRINGRYDGAGSVAGYSGTWFETVSVDAFETIVTKAGRFDVFVVTRKEEAVSHRFRSTFRQWYAPALGMTVKFSFEDNQGTNRASEAIAIRQP